MSDTAGAHLAESFQCGPICCKPPTRRPLVFYQSGRDNAGPDRHLEAPLRAGQALSGSVAALITRSRKLRQSPGCPFAVAVEQPGPSEVKVPVTDPRPVVMKAWQLDFPGPLDGSCAAMGFHRYGHPVHVGVEPGGDHVGVRGNRKAASADPVSGVRDELVGEVAVADEPVTDAGGDDGLAQRELYPHCIGCEPVASAMACSPRCSDRSGSPELSAMVTWRSTAWATTSVSP